MNILSSRLAAHGSPRMISTLLAIELLVVQWLEHPNLNAKGREFDSHLELGLF